MTRKDILTVGLVVVGIAVVVLLKLKFERFNIPQNGMYPSRPAGSTHWVTKNPYDSIDDVEVGDVVVFRHDVEGQTYVYVWRVIALPGDDVLIEGDEVTINGQQLAHEPMRSEGSIDLYFESQRGAKYPVVYDSDAPDRNRRSANLTVPEGHLFMLGDNRYNAMDSRFHGPVAFEAVFGKM